MRPAAGCPEDGFTLVEILVAMTVSLAVLLATLQSFDLFTSNAATQTRVTDANDQVRSTMDRTVRDLRGASVVLRADDDDLAYAVPQASGVRIERICVDSLKLYRSSTPAASAVAPTGPCTSATSIAKVSAAAVTPFTYDSVLPTAPLASPATVKNVGLRFSLDASGAGRTASSTLTASAAVRSTAGTLPVGDDDVQVACGQDGPLIQIGVGLPVDLGPLTVTYVTNGNVTIAGGSVTASGSGQVTLLPPSTASVVAIITDAIGITRATINKPVGCVA